MTVMSEHWKQGTDFSPELKQLFQDFWNAQFDALGSSFVMMNGVKVLRRRNRKAGTRRKMRRQRR